jgi:hypothetical protein
VSSLVETQRLLAAAIDRNPDESETARLLRLIVADTPGLEVEKRLSVYCDSSRRARERALESIYPVCRQVLGQRCFATLAADYIAGYPSTTGDLNHYGAELPGLLEKQIEDNFELAQVPYIGDLARLEWHWHSAYYAPNDPNFDMPRFSALAATGQIAQVRFQLSAALQLLASDYPIADIWRRHREGSDTSAVAMGEGDRLIIQRVAFRPGIESLEAEAFALMNGLSEGKTLGSLADEGHAIETIPGLIAAGWIVDFSVAEVL